MAKVSVEINGKKVTEEVSDNTILSDTSFVIFSPLIFTAIFAIIIPPKITPSN